MDFEELYKPWSSPTSQLLVSIKFSLLCLALWFLGSNKATGSFQRLWMKMQHTQYWTKFGNRQHALLLCFYLTSMSFAKPNRPSLPSEVYLHAFTYSLFGSVVEMSVCVNLPMLYNKPLVFSPYSDPRCLIFSTLLRAISINPQPNLPLSFLWTLFLPDYLILKQRTFCFNGKCLFLLRCYT